MEEEEREEGEMLAIITGEKSLITWNEGKSPVTENDEEEDESSEEENDENQTEILINPGVAEAIGIPSKSDFSSLNVAWMESGDSMLLSGRESFCCAYPLSPPSL